MFIRESKTKNKKTGKVYIKHSLVESVRTERGPRQRLVMTLGKLELDRKQWKDLALSLELYLNGEHELEHLSLYELSEELLEEITRQRAAIGLHQSRLAKPAVSDNKNNSEEDLKNIQQVDINTLTVTESRSMGPELLAHDAWEALGFASLLNDCGFTARETALAAAAIWGRLIQPGSDLATWRWLRENSSLPDFFDADISRVHKDKIYSIADKLLASKDKLEELTAKIYLDAKKTKNTFTRDLNLILKTGLVVEEDGLYKADLYPIVKRLPFSV